MTTVAGVVLAAGAGRRMGQPKAELVLDGRRLIDRAVGVLTDAGCAPVYAVVRQATKLSGARALVNEAPERGLRSSLQIAVDATVASALVVILVDMPGVTAGSVATVVAAWRPGRIVMANYAARSGHPIVMSTQMWRDALAVADADGGARAFLARHPDLVDAVPVEGSGEDLDTPADLESWTALS